MNKQMQAYKTKQAKIKRPAQVLKIQAALDKIQEVIYKKVI
jgi:hypothetical protein